MVYKGKYGDTRGIIFHLCYLGTVARTSKKWWTVQWWIQWCWYCFFLFNVSV